MKINIGTKELKKIVELVDNANYKIAGNEPINTQAICIRADASTVSVIALNQEIYINIPAIASITEPGSVIVDHVALKSSFKSISASSIDISLDKKENKVIFTADSDTVEMPNLQLIKFSKLPNFENKKKLCSVIADTLASSIRAVTSAIPTKAPQVALNSCCLEFDLGNISFVGFDGFKLIKYDLKMQDMDDLDFREKILIPSEAAIAITRSLQKGKSEVDMSFCENNSKRYLVIEKDAIVIAVRLRDYSYPNYDQLLRSDYEFTFVVNQGTLKDTMSAVNGIGSAKEALPVHFIFDKDKVTLRFVTPDSTVSKTLDIKSQEGNPYRFKMLAKSLKEVYPYLGENIRIKVFKGGLLIITPEDNNNYVFVSRTLE